MKENNKFSLSAFFYSLASKSKQSKLVLLGAPFLVLFFSLKVSASTVAVPGTDGLLVAPSGGINSPIHNVLKMDTGSINSSIWVALGLDPLDLYDIVDEANEAYQDGNDIVYEAIIAALNEQDSGSGDLLDYVIQSSFQASSQSGYVGKISIPDDVWTRINKATKNGLNIKIRDSSVSNISSSSDFLSYVNNFYGSSVALLTSHQSSIVDSILEGGNWSIINDYTRYGSSVNSTIRLVEGFSNFSISSNTVYINSSLSDFRVVWLSTPSSTRWNDSSFNSAVNIGPTSYYENGGSYSVLTSNSGSVVSKHIGVASDFITNKANENYDIVSKSSTYNPDTGKIEGARSINLITPDYLSQLVASLRDGILSLPEALQRLGIGAIDTDQAIPIGVGFDIDTLSHVVAQSVPQEATAAATREAFQQLDNFTFYTPDDFIGLPSVSPLPVAMNWLAVQMQTMMGLTSFQNCWVVLSTLAVLSLLVGIIRLSK